jgi:hypothetical protein
MKNVYFPIFLLGSILFFSCEDRESPCFAGAGEMGEKLVVLPSFTTLVTYDIFDIDLVQDTTNFLVLETGENVIPSITIDTSENSVILNNELPCRWSKGYPTPKITLHFKKLKKLDLKEPCTVVTRDTIHGTSLSIALWTGMIDMDLILDYHSLVIGTSRNIAGKVTLAGNAVSSYITGRGALAVEANNFMVDNVNAENNSIADFHFNVSNSITVRLKNTGNIYCTGNPDKIILQVKEDSGDLILVGK